MTTPPGPPGAKRRGPLRMPRSRGAREAVIALLALPVLLLVGVQIGEQLRGDPASPVAAPVTSPPAASPQATPAPDRTARQGTAAPASTASPTARPVSSAPATRLSPPPSTRPPVARPPVASPPVASPPATRAPAPRPPRDAVVASGTEPPPPRFALSLGSVGAKVRQWQQRMVFRGWRLDVDGIFGRRSAAVARQFQKEKDLLVDGLVGSRTWRATWRLPITP